MRDRITERDCVRALKHRYSSKPYGKNEWALITQLTVGPNHTSAERRASQADHLMGAETDWDPRDHLESCMDAWAMHLYKDFLHAFEIKVDPADFEREIANPEKRRPAMALANMFFFVAPKGMLSIDQIPEDCGLLEVEGRQRRNSTFVDYSLLTTKNAPYRDIEELPRHFIASIALRAS